MVVSPIAPDASTSSATAPLTDNLITAGSFPV